jgi:broad specificity phosphatase PhoE
VPEVQKWPQIIWIVRHGESAGNIARDAALLAGLPSIDISTRDVDVPLSELGKEQSAALGRWFGKMSEEERPTVVLTSPYLRARDTAEIVLFAADIERNELVFNIDERLREKEFGILDRLTRLGIQQKFPDEAARYGILGKFYYRPPGGESWCDVILRLRSLLEMIVREYRGERVLIVGHQVVVHCLRYLLERMTEEEILAIDKVADLANCSVTSYEFDRSLGKQGKLALRLFNFVAPLEEEGAPITTSPDIPLASK